MSELGMNKAMLIGRSDGGAELRFTAAGKPVANFSLAINESFRPVAKRAGRVVSKYWMSLKNQWVRELPLRGSESPSICSRGATMGQCA